MVTASFPQTKPLSDEDLRKIDAYWRACHYLAVGMIYLRDNPLLKEPLKPEHVKHRLLGHWGASPALSFTYLHCNRLIKKYDLDMIFMAGPGHGAPGVLGPVYLEGTYSEFYPDKTFDELGMQKFFKQFSFPGHIGSHVTPETPGSIHEGGELGYSVSHAYGAVLDNPDLIVTCVVGDGESETGPLATAWHSNKFINPIRDGAVLPVLNLNGYKIANPTILARISHEELEFLFRGYGYTPYFVEGRDPAEMHQKMAATMELCVNDIRAIQQECRNSGNAERPRWPLIVLRTPKGWTGPQEVDGHKVEDFWRAHQVPMGGMHSNPEHLRRLEEWMKSYRPEEFFDDNGVLLPELQELSPVGDRRMSANPKANGGLVRRELKLPNFRDYAIEIGYLCNDGRWLLLARSAQVHIPPVYPSDWIEDHFMTVGWDQDLRGTTITTLTHPTKRVETAYGSNELYEEIFGMAESAEAQRIAGSLFGSMQHVPGSAVSSFAMPVSSYVFPSGVGMWAGEVPTMSGLTMSGAGFSASAPPIRPREFWLVADAELIVYGATEPDATVTVGGKPIKLNSDGTFRFQMSFQDGLIDYPIFAVAADGEQNRAIHMKFNRETPYRRTNTKEDAVEEWLV